MIRGGALLLTLLALSGCHNAKKKMPFTEALFALSDEARGTLKLAVPNAGRARRELKRLVESLRPARQENGAALVARLNATIFEQLAYKRDLRADVLEPTLLPAVLARRVGSCTGLGALYLALGEQLDLPLRGVLLPGHFLVHLAEQDRPAIEIELLRRGASMPAEWYQKRYAPPQKARDYGRALSPDESLAVFRYNLANAYRRAGRNDRALTLYRQVTRRLPGFAEAQAQMGQLLLARGKRREAHAAFEAALRANPHLPGLDAWRRQASAKAGDQPKRRRPPFLDQR